MITSRKSIILFVLAGILLFLQYQLWFTTGGVFEMMRMKRQLAQQENINLQLRKRNEALLLQVQRLQKSDDAVETRARNELGMVKKGETFYQMVR